MPSSPTVLIHRHGDVDVLETTTVEVADPGAGEVRIRQTAIGLNFADIYQRRGSHGPHAPTPFPITLGAQGAGIVEAVGAGVDGLREGQRVAYFHPGAYQVVRNVPAERIVVLPEGFTEEWAGATLLRGLTAEYLLHRLHTIVPGEPILVHAAAGGMGQVLVPWARDLGAVVIGTAGGPDKCDVARAYGCHHVIDYRHEDFVARTLEATDGRGVAVVYDAVGKDVFVRSLDCLRPRGHAINYGTASGDVEGFELQRLHAKSLTVTRPTLRTFIATREDLQAGAARYFDAVARGAVRIDRIRRYRLADIRVAHADLEGRRTSGAVVLVP